jgi:antitoxin component of MazEF toxin-antitoxin module
VGKKPRRKDTSRLRREVAPGGRLTGEIAVENGSIIVSPKGKRRTKYSLREMLKQCRPEHFHPLIDFGPDVGREVIE